MLLASLTDDDLQSLGDSCISRFEQGRDVSDIEQGLEVYKQLTQRPHIDQESFASRLQNLAHAFQLRFERTGTFSDIEEAISNNRKAVEATPSGNEHLVSRLTDLANTLALRFQRTGDVVDIDEAIATRRRAIDITPQRSANLQRLFKNLGISLQSRFQLRGELTDLESAIEAKKKAAGLISEGDHDDRPSILDSLANSYSILFESTSDMVALSEAISLHRQALDLTPSDHLNLSHFHNNLAASLFRRFERGRDLSDINQAIDFQRRVVQSTPSDHPGLSDELSNLGSYLQSRFERVEDLADLNEAISARQSALDRLSPGHPHRPSAMNSLALSFLTRSQQTNDLSDIDQAISLQEKAVDITPVDHKSFPGWLINLSSSFQERYQRTKNQTDIDKAIAHQERAIMLTPSGHADLIAYHSHLGNSFLFRVIQTGSLGDLEACMSHYKLVATQPIGDPNLKITAARYWASFSHQLYPSSSETIEAFDTVIRLLSLVAGLEQTIEQRHELLKDTPGLSELAAASACFVGRVDKAFEWLEHGRCLVWSQISQLRTPLQDLSLKHSDLARRLLETSTALERAGSRQLTNTSSATADEEAFSHIKLAKEWDNLLREVRGIPNFEHFLQPLPCSSLLQHLPPAGTIILISASNTHQDRCDAIALRPGLDKPIHIPLPSFSVDKGEQLRRDLICQLQFFGARSPDADTMQEGEIENRKPRRAPEEVIKSNNATKDILATLWTDLVKPILDGLSFSPKTSELPRIWWCTAGPLASLPVHAAGIYSKDAVKSNLFDYAVSSYTPTVAALTSRLKNPQKFPHHANGLLLVSQPDAPGQSSISGTTVEIDAIQKLAKKHGIKSLTLEGEKAGINPTLDNMKKFNSIHLACHAMQDEKEPLRSGFFLHDGRLDLSTIMQHNLPNANFAFLSACQTSAGEEQLSDEAVHLAAGMLAAGYRGVVATMWSIGDRYAPGVARDFYEYLLAGSLDGAEVDGSKASYALHYAIRKLQDKLEKSSERSLLAWAAYVHYGV
ncbi:hypothetical protein FA15DRAFT_249760 [Coprinopsis marcescibilis]|uniref:CHAT domain-containing protein n=1 Tax=Coprinopsis marcescibilis TaxID=230819 RepID=A0A5C3KFE9_COPMA|nr:hypothetical protein FA15DRAFT_249760 [Coprinopsis marcescibilis]